MVRHSFLSPTVPFLSKNVGRKRCRKRLLWNHVRPAAPGGRNKDEYSGGARAGIVLPRIAPRRRGGAAAAGRLTYVLGGRQVCLFRGLGETGTGRRARPVFCALLPPPLLPRIHPKDHISGVANRETRGLAVCRGDPPTSGARGYRVSRTVDAGISRWNI